MRNVSDLGIGYVKGTCVLCLSHFSILAWTRTWIYVVVAHELTHVFHHALADDVLALGLRLSLPTQSLSPRMYDTLICKCEHAQFASCILRCRWKGWVACYHRLVHTETSCNSRRYSLQLAAYVLECPIGRFSFARHSALFIQPWLLPHSCLIGIFDWYVIHGTYVLPAQLRFGSSWGLDAVKPCERIRGRLFPTRTVMVGVCINLVSPDDSPQALLYDMVRPDCVHDTCNCLGLVWCPRQTSTQSKPLCYFRLHFFGINSSSLIKIYRVAVHSGLTWMFRNSTWLLLPQPNTKRSITARIIFKILWSSSLRTLSCLYYACGTYCVIWHQCTCSFFLANSSFARGLL